MFSLFLVHALSNSQELQSFLKERAIFSDSSNFKYIRQNVSRENGSIDSNDIIGIRYRFTGTKCWLTGDRNIKNNNISIFLDNKQVSSQHSDLFDVEFGEILYSSNTLDNQSHIIEIFIPKIEKSRIRGIYYINDQLDVNILDIQQNNCLFDLKNNYIKILIYKFGPMKLDIDACIYIKGLNVNGNETMLVKHNIIILSNESNKTINLPLNIDSMLQSFRIELISSNSIVGLDNIIYRVHKQKESIMSHKRSLATGEGRINKEMDQFTNSNDSDWGHGAAYFTDVAGAYKEIQIEFSKAWVYGTKRPGHGKVNVYIDGKFKETFTLKVAGGSEEVNVLVYETPYLGYGTHALKFEKPTGTASSGEAVSLNSVDFLVTESIFSLEASAVTMDKGRAIALNIKRTAFINEKTSVTVVTEDLTAKSGENYKELNQVVTFEGSEVTKVVAVKAMFYANSLGDLTFKCKLTNPSAGSELGDTTETTVTIDQANYTKPYFIYKKANSDNTETTGPWEGNKAVNDDETFYPASNTNGVASKTFTFTGTMFAVLCKRATGHNDFKMTIDNGETIVVNTYGDDFFRHTCYLGQDLPYKEHKVKIWREDDLTIKFSLNGFITVDHSYFGSIDFTQPSVKLNKNQRVNIDLRRGANTYGVVTAKATTNAIKNAIEGTNYVGIDEELIFIDGVASLSLPIQLLDSYVKKHSSLSIALSNPGGFAGIGTNNKIIININSDPTYAFTASNGFSNSNIFVKSNEFTQSTLFENTEEFSNSKLFVKTNHFSFSEEYHKTNLFSRSNLNTESLLFTHSSIFFKTHGFSQTNEMSSSNIFYETNLFTISNVFKKTDIFSMTGDFYLSQMFSSSYNFLKTDGFQETELFSKSSDFLKTELFSKSIDFLKTEMFSKSNDFLKTELFSKSIDFIKSDAYSNSIDFSSSSNFQGSIDFSRTKLFIPTNMMSSSNNFDITSIFTTSQCFENTERFTISDAFKKTIEFSESKEISKSDIFKETIHFSKSINFIDSDHFTRSELFIESTIFSGSSIFKKTEEYSRSSGFHKTSLYSLSIMFSLSSSTRKDESTKTAINDRDMITSEPRENSITNILNLNEEMSSLNFQTTSDNLKEPTKLGTHFDSKLMSDEVAETQAKNNENLWSSNNEHENYVESGTKRPFASNENINTERSKNDETLHISIEANNKESVKLSQSDELVKQSLTKELTPNIFTKPKSEENKEKLEQTSHNIENSFLHESIDEDRALTNLNDSSNTFNTKEEETFTINNEKFEHTFHNTDITIQPESYVDRYQQLMTSSSLHELTRKTKSNTNEFGTKGSSEEESDLVINTLIKNDSSIKKEQIVIHSKTTESNFNFLSEDLDQKSHINNIEPAKSGDYNAIQSTTLANNKKSNLNTKEIKNSINISLILEEQKSRSQSIVTKLTSIHDMIETTKSRNDFTSTKLEPIETLKEIKHSTNKQKSEEIVTNSKSVLPVKSNPKTLDQKQQLTLVIKVETPNSKNSLVNENKTEITYIHASKASSKANHLADYPGENEARANESKSLNGGQIAGIVIGIIIVAIIMIILVFILVIKKKSRTKSTSLSFGSDVEMTLDNDSTINMPTANAESVLTIFEDQENGDQDEYDYDYTYEEVVFTQFDM